MVQCLVTGWMVSLSQVGSQRYTHVHVNTEHWYDVMSFDCSWHLRYI